MTIKLKKITNKKTLKADNISFHVVSDQLGSKSIKLITNFAKLLDSLSENVKKHGEQEAFKLLHKVFILINEYSSLLNGKDKAVFKELIKKHVLSITNQSLLCWYAWKKIKNFNGDYGVTELIWNGQVISKQSRYQGTTENGMMLNAFILDLPVCRANIHKVYKMAELIGNPKYNNIGVFGSNAILEIDLAYEKYDMKDKSIHVYEQYNEAVQHAKKKLGASHNNIKFFRKNIVKAILSKPIQKYDIIYSMGVFNYFEKKSTKRLISNLWSKVQPGGKLVLSNAHPLNSSRFFIDYIIDWNIRYKDEEDLKDCIKGLRQVKHTKLELDEYNVYQFLTLTKNEID